MYTVVIDMTELMAAEEVVFYDILKATMRVWKFNKSWREWNRILVVSTINASKVSHIIIGYIYHAPIHVNLL